MTSNYWQKRLIKTQDRITNRGIYGTEQAIQKIYKRAYKDTCKEFEAVYDKIEKARAAGEEITPAWLYQLDKYWELQAQLKADMDTLSRDSISYLSESFEAQYKDIYESIVLPSDSSFNTYDVNAAKQIVNNAWCTDGKNWSQRVWGNTQKLSNDLLDGLTHCAIVGASKTKLRETLMENYNVSRGRANTLIRTEMTHIQTEAAVQRYKDYGFEYYEFLGREEHDIGCDCKRLNGKKFKLSEKQPGVNCPPLHPNCRCCIVPVVNDEDDYLDRVKRMSYSNK